MPDLRAAETAITTLSETADGGEVAAWATRLGQQALELLGAPKPASTLTLAEERLSDYEQGLAHEQLVEGVSLPSERPSIPSFQNLLAQMKTERVTVADILASKTENNLLGTGNDHSVWAIPKLSDYAIRDSRRGSLSSIPTDVSLKAVPDVLPSLNLGQPVATLGKSQIIKRVGGTPHGPDYWGPKADTISHAEADDEYAAAIRTVARMPQKAFDHLAHTLKAAGEAGLEFDPINPNNVLVDRENEQFNPIDFLPHRGVVSNKLIDMLAALANPFKFHDMNMLPSLEQEYIELIQKSVLAAERAGLKKDGLFYDAVKQRKMFSADFDGRIGKLFPDVAQAA